MRSLVCHLSRSIKNQISKKNPLQIAIDCCSILPIEWVFELGFVARVGEQTRQTGVGPKLSEIGFWSRKSRSGKNLYIHLKYLKRRSSFWTHLPIGEQRPTETHKRKGAQIEIVHLQKEVKVNILFSRSQLLLRLCATFTPL
tara:strand:+ start:1386 stop:1811 length:426 start_codon:yes stop_codon:yes gene_type:complete